MVSSWAKMRPASSVLTIINKKKLTESDSANGAVAGTTAMMAWAVN